MALTAIVTNAGRAALVNASNTGTAPVAIAQVGLTATAVVPGVGITALPGEYKRIATISGDVVADDTIHLIVRDESADVFTVRSFALYLADGTLFAIYGQAEAILEKSAQAIMLLAIDVQFADVAATMLTFGDTNFLNPPATTERQGVVELATVAEAQAGIDALRALTPVAAKAAILGWLLAQDGSGSGLDADLLDGQDGSYYANIPQRLGYTPANRAGDTFTGNLAISKIGSQELHFSGTGNYKWRAIGTNLAGSGGNFHLQYTTDNFGSSFVSGLMLTPAGMASSQGQGVFWGPNNDGAGSGLDADLLDGQDGSYYSNITQRLGYVPLPVTGGTMTGKLTLESAVPWIAMSETDTGKQWHVITDGSSFSVREDTSSGANTRLLIQPGSLRLTLDSTLQWGGSTVWHAGNDGAGSGLDADLLDGQDSGYYSNIPQRLGYTPVNKAGDTMSGTLAFSAGNLVFSSVHTAEKHVEFVRAGQTAYLYASNVALGLYDTQYGSVWNWAYGGAFYIQGGVAWHSSNDGAGSGLDADLLDGQQGSYYSDVAGRLGFTPVQQGGGTGQGTNKIYIGWHGPSLRLKGQVDVTDLGAFVFDQQIANVWRASNDGSGSGLDADLLDGYQATDFDRIVSQNLTANGGYIVYASGRKETWGTITIGQDSYATYTLPTAHSSWVHPTYGVNTAGGNTQIQQNTGVTAINGSPPTSITFWNADDRTVTVWVRTTGV